MKMLSFFHYCPFCGSENIVVKTKKCIECVSCKFVYYHNVAAACALIIEYKDKIILTVRKNNPAKGKLDLPGGFVDYSECAEDALKREIREELNIEISDFSYINSYPNIYKYKKVKYKTLDLIYTAKIENLDNIKPGDDVKDYILKKPGDIDIKNIGLGSIKTAISDYIKNLS